MAGLLTASRGWRIKGDAQQAQIYERAFEHAYKTLPTHLRWHRG
jgi:hypothetical protein